MTNRTTTRKPLSLTANRRQSLVLLLLTLACGPLPAEAPAPASQAFDHYAAQLDSRLATQHLTAATFLALLSPADQQTLRTGQPILEEIPGTPRLESAMLHHWRGTMLVPGAHAADFEQLLREISRYPQRFAPQVLSAHALSTQALSAQPTSPSGNHITTAMRIRQTHILTVVLDATYELQFARLDPRHGFCISRSTRVSEVENPGSPAEHLLAPGREHGYLWRLNTYWTWAETDSGLLIQVETLSLSRAIPRSLAWAIQPFVSSVPRESLEFTLRSASQALTR